MICISLRSAFISRGCSFVISWPLKMTSPEVGSIRRRMQRPVVDLPQPDSPTTPRVLPFSMEKETSSTAWSLPRGVSKYFFQVLDLEQFLSHLLSLLSGF